MNCLSQKVFKRFVYLIFAYSLVSCSSSFQTVYKTPPTKYESLGLVSGSASGSLGIISPDLYVVPMGLNSRIEKAYENALEQAPGATSLIDISYQESWFWWFIGTGRRVTIYAEAIKEIK